MGNRVEIVVGNKIFTDFKEVKIRTTIDAAAASLEITTVHRDDLPFRNGAYVSVYFISDRQNLPPEFIGSGTFPNPNFERESQPVEHLAFRGFIDEIEPEIGESGRVMKIRGRSWSADAVDSSAMNSPGEWNDVELHTLVAEIGEAVGVVVGIRTADPRPERFAKFRLQPGESAFEAIERAARLRGRLVYPNLGTLEVALPSADLVNASSGQIRGELREGDDGNVKSAKLKDSWRNRYHRYVVRGQDTGTDERFGDALATEGEAFDLRLEPKGFGPQLRRVRTLLILADKPLSDKEAEDRAKWEANVRAARGTRLEVQLQGWKVWPTEDHSKLWAPNFLVPTRIHSLRMFETLLIASVTLTRSPTSGTTTTLECMRRDAFLIDEREAADAVDESTDPAVLWDSDS